MEGAGNDSCCSDVTPPRSSNRHMLIWNGEMKKPEGVCLSTTKVKATNGGNGSDGSTITVPEPSRLVHTAILPENNSSLNKAT